VEHTSDAGYVVADCFADPCTLKHFPPSEASQDKREAIHDEGDRKTPNVRLADVAKRLFHVEVQAPEHE
jgi:hypothetical protein